MKQLLARIRARVSRITVKKTLLAIESCLTIPFFVTSWFVCAIGFAVKAGFLMAQSEGAAKSSALDKLLKSDP